MSAPTFDPVAYKETTRRQRQEAAEGVGSPEGRHRAPARPCDGAHARPCRGAGGQPCARRRRGRGRAVARGGPPRRGRLRAGDRHLVEPPRVRGPTRPGGRSERGDARGRRRADRRRGGVVRRGHLHIGFICFPDQQAALAGMWRALRPGGKLAGIVYSTAQANPFFSIPVSIIRRRAQLPPPAPGRPGPFSFGEPGVIEAAYERAGFTGIETRRVAAPLRLGSAAERVRFEQESFGALHQMPAGLDEHGREEAWKEIRSELRQFERDGSFEGPCELLVAVGTT